MIKVAHKNKSKKTTVSRKSDFLLLEFVVIFKLKVILLNHKKFQQIQKKEDKTKKLLK